MTNSYVIDASALLVLINAESGHEKVAEYLPSGCMSTVNLSEVAALLHTTAMPDKEIKDLINGLVGTTIIFDEQQAYQAAQLKTLTKRTGLSLGDRACLALGKIKNLPVVTADKVWSKLNLDIEVILVR